MKTTLRPYRPIDAYLIELRELDKKDMAGMDWFYLAFVYWGQSQVAWTIEREDGAIVACGGVRVTGPEGHAWIISSALVDEYPLAFHRAVKGWLYRAMREFGLNRVSTTVLKEHAVSRNWLRRLGMKPCGVLKKSGCNGLDRLIYTRVAK